MQLVMKQIPFLRKQCIDYFLMKINRFVGKMITGLFDAVFGLFPFPLSCLWLFKTCIDHNGPCISLPLASKSRST